MGISMIVFSLILLMFFAYRGYSIIFIAPILAAFSILFQEKTIFYSKIIRPYR